MLEQFKGDYETCVQIEDSGEKICVQVLCYESGCVARAELSMKTASQLAAAINYRVTLAGGEVPATGPG